MTEFLRCLYPITKDFLELTKIVQIKQQFKPGGKILLIYKHYLTNLEFILFSQEAIKINERGWRQNRHIIITTRGFYNFNKKS
jgi:hypothetical protein